MTDTLSKEQRSWLMGRVKSRNTKPELLARRILHSLGYRYTINGPSNNKLPGKPDIVLPKYKSAIFVHGCFWHRHSECKHATTPKSNQTYWTAKFARNVERDQRVKDSLISKGWHVVVVWECELKDIPSIASRFINEFPRQTMLQFPPDIDDQKLVAETAANYGR